MLYAYTNHLLDVSIELQRDKLRDCERCFSDINYEQKQLKALLAEIRQGDTIRVYSLRVFPLSTLELIKMVHELNQKKVVLDSCSENLSGQYLFTILENYQHQFRKRLSRAAVEGKRKRGTKGGRKKGLSEEAQAKIKTAVTLYNSNKMTINEIMSAIKINSKTTLYKYLRLGGVQIGNYPKQEEFLGTIDDEPRAEYKTIKKEY